MSDHQNLPRPEAELERAARLAITRDWLHHARSDLLSAQALQALERPRLDTAIYHCQQAAEKVVKAFLAYSDQEIERIHDVERLVTQAAKLDERFGRWRDEGRTLTPYAFDFRYPGVASRLEPTRAEFDEALDAAERLVAFVFGLLPKEVLPVL